MKVKCSLCDMEFEDMDNDFLKRIIRHNDWHDVTIKGTSRDSNYYNQKSAYKKRNIISGIPKYIPIK